MSAGAWAFAAGALGGAAVVELAMAGGPELRRRAPRLLGSMTRTAEALVLAGTEGRDPGAAERRRMLLAGAALAFAGGLLIFGLLPALALGAGGPWLASRLLGARRERYRRAVERDSAAIAVSVADALGAGHSLRGALGEAAQGLSEIGRAHV